MPNPVNHPFNSWPTPADYAARPSTFSVSRPAARPPLYPILFVIAYVIATVGWLIAGLDFFSAIAAASASLAALALAALAVVGCFALLFG